MAPETPSDLEQEDTDLSRFGEVAGISGGNFFGSGVHHAERHSPFLNDAANIASKNSMYSLNTLQTWLTEQGEPREAHLIPPSELDAYLVTFYRTVKQKRGDDYKRNSLMSLRKFINMNLKEKGYPHSIVKSVHFFNSQVAFRERMAELEAPQPHKSQQDFSGYKDS